jgi:hypothetical protein
MAEKLGPSGAVGPDALPPEDCAKRLLLLLVLLPGRGASGVASGGRPRRAAELADACEAAGRPHADGRGGRADAELALEDLADSGAAAGLSLGGRRGGKLI